MNSDALRLFFQGATHYYVAGRYAAIAGLSPTAGNLLHHAIEMYLKGALSKTVSLDELKKLSHNLPKIWESFKIQAGDPALANFDPLVSSLDAFEDLRYPDSILARGMATSVGVGRGIAPPLAAMTVRPEPSYEVYIEETDALVGTIFEVSSVNPTFVLSGLSGRARESLKEFNTQSWGCSDALEAGGSHVREGEMTERKLQQLTLVSEYIKFHIGLYLATPPVIVIVAQGLNVDACSPFVAGLILMIAAFSISGVSAGRFMGEYVNALWDDARLKRLSAEAHSRRRRNMHHGLYWVGLAFGVGGLIGGLLSRWLTNGCA